MNFSGFFTRFGPHIGLFTEIPLLYPLASNQSLSFDRAPLVAETFNTLGLGCLGGLDLFSLNFLNLLNLLNFQ